MNRTSGTERDSKKIKESRIPTGCGPSRGDSAEKRNSKADSARGASGQELSLNIHRRYYI